MIKVKDIVQRFEQFAPPAWAEKGDPIGLQLGSLEQEVHKVMVTLDVRPEVVAEAIAEDVDFIFAHHPAMFKPITKFDLSVPQNQMYAELIKHDITVYGAHTNLDNANGGMNDWLAELLQIEHTNPLMPLRYPDYYKLAVYVPVKAEDHVRQALNAAGAGCIGEYTGCAYTAPGTGYFVPGKDAQPTIGNINEATAVSEVKIEVVVAARDKNKVLQAMYASHPYEEPVFDLYRLENFGTPYGMGRIGTLAEATTVTEYAKFCKNVLGVDHVRLVTSDPGRLVRTVAVLGGSGSRFYPQALRQGADVYVTADVTYHTGHDIIASGLSVIDPGHHFEAICKSHLQSMFEQWSDENDWQIQVVSSKINTDPFSFI